MNALFLTLLAVADAGAAPCDMAALSAARQAFHRLYKAKHYRQALDVLEPTWAKCEGGLPVEQRAWILSDLSIAAYRNGEKKRCLQFLDRVPGRAFGLFSKAIERNRDLCRGTTPGWDQADCGQGDLNVDLDFCPPKIMEGKRVQLATVSRAAIEKVRGTRKGDARAWQKAFRRADQAWSYRVNRECDFLVELSLGGGSGMNAAKADCESALLGSWIQAIQNRFELPGQTREEPVDVGPCGDSVQCPRVLELEAKRKALSRKTLADPEAWLPPLEYGEDPKVRIAQWKESMRESEKRWLEWRKAWCVDSLRALTAIPSVGPAPPRSEGVAECLVRTTTEELRRMQEE